MLPRIFALVLLSCVCAQYPSINTGIYLICDKFVDATITVVQLPPFDLRIEWYFMGENVTDRCYVKNCEFNFCSFKRECVEKVELVTFKETQTRRIVSSCTNDPVGTFQDCSDVNCPTNSICEIRWDRTCGTGRKFWRCTPRA